MPITRKKSPKRDPIQPEQPVFTRILVFLRPMKFPMLKRIPSHYSFKAREASPFATERTNWHRPFSTLLPPPINLSRPHDRSRNGTVERAISSFQILSAVLSITETLLYVLPSYLRPKWCFLLAHSGCLTPYAFCNGFFSVAHFFRRFADHHQKNLLFVGLKCADFALGALGSL